MIDELNTRLNIPPGYYIKVGPVESPYTLTYQRVVLYRSSGKWYWPDKKIVSDLLFVDEKTWKPMHSFDISLSDIIKAVKKIKLPPIRPGRHA